MPGVGRQNGDSNMNPYKQQFAEISSEYLLQRRALGDQLSEDAHVAIEEIFAERGEQLPPRPSAPIYIPDQPLPDTKSRRSIRWVFIFVLGLLAIGVAKWAAHTWVGFLLWIGIILYELSQPRSSPGRALSPEENLALARRDELTELMMCAADGNISRIKELIAYGHDVNARSHSGSTALMYAARNNRVECIHYLLASGADPAAVSDKGSTALSFATKFGHTEAETALRGNASR